MRRRKNKWFCDVAKYSDVVLSSSVSLSRNFLDYEFPAKLKEEKATELVEHMRSLMGDLALIEGVSFYSCRVDKLNNIEKDSMIECHTITPSMKRKKEPVGLIFSEDEGISIMVNDDDHLRIQAQVAGNHLRNAYKTANRLDDYFDSVMQYCYSDKFGYLTSKPQDTGTGMKATYILSLPALTMGGKIETLQEEVNRFGVVLQGTYGEGSKSTGFVFQISNRKTLGVSENDILENLEQVVAQIINIERKARRDLLNANRDEMADRMYRSYGVLKYAKLLSQKDAMLLLAQLKLGCDVGVLKLKDGGAGIYRLMIESQPGNLQKIEGKSLGSRDRDRVRAEYLNENLPEFDEPVTDGEEAK